jgi:hypothetical protein
MKAFLTISFASTIGLFVLFGLLPFVAFAIDANEMESIVRSNICPSSDEIALLKTSEECKQNCTSASSKDSCFGEWQRCYDDVDKLNDEIRKFNNFVRLCRRTNPAETSTQRHALKAVMPSRGAATASGETSTEHGLGPIAVEGMKRREAAKQAEIREREQKVKKEADDERDARSEAERRRKEVAEKDRRAADEAQRAKDQQAKLDRERAARDREEANSWLCTSSVGVTQVICFRYRSFNLELSRNCTPEALSKPFGRYCQTIDPADRERFLQRFKEYRQYVE